MATLRRDPVGALDPHQPGPCLGCDDCRYCLRSFAQLHAEVVRLRDELEEMDRQREHWWRAWLGLTAQRVNLQFSGINLGDFVPRPRRTDWGARRAAILRARGQSDRAIRLREASDGDSDPT